MSAHKNIASFSLRLVGLVCSAALLLSACGPKEPVRVGYLGGTSGRVADLGISGRNGTQLAVDLINQKGGIDGRKVELIVRDDEQNAEVAKQRFKELVNAKVAAVVGPMTSGMAVAILPLINENKLLTFGATCTANELGDKDDYFFRVIGSARVYANLSAQYQYGVQGLRKVSVILDGRNKAYSESWAGDFRTSFEQLGGKVVSYRIFESGDEAGLGGLVEESLRAGPDGVVLVGNSVDAALLTQQIRKRAPTLKLATSEWAATERYIELAGKAAEGVVMAQFFDRGSSKPEYLEFRKKYLERFGEEPGFGSVAAFDAANVVLAALGKNPNQAPKETILGLKKFSGLQNEIEIDATGDARRDTLVTIIRDGKFVVVPRQ